MNDTPITDFDKLKNTLIEIGVEFDVITKNNCIIIYDDYTASCAVISFAENGQYTSKENND